MAWKRNEDNRNKTLRRAFDKAKEKQIEEQKTLEFNFYIQKKMMDYPDTWEEEIRKDIEAFERVDKF